MAAALFGEFVGLSIDWSTSLALLSAAEFESLTFPPSPSPPSPPPSTLLFEVTETRFFLLGLTGLGSERVDCFF
jgi:hypothetical protein